MNPEEIALKALADADRETEASPLVEARLRTAFRNRNTKTRIWKWIPITAAAAILVVVAVLARHPQPMAEPVRGLVQPAPVVRMATAVTPVETKKARVRRTAQPTEIVTDFFPLAGYAGPVDDGELLRVTLPASAMREVGLPVREDRLTDRVQADVLVSHGMATAVRFVKNSE
jgi:hypothetical protein